MALIKSTNVKTKSSLREKALPAQNIFKSKLKIKELMLGAVLCGAITATAQDSTRDSIAISGYLETYYSYEFNRPISNTKPVFIYNHNRDNELNLNIGFVKAAYSSDKVRVNLALAAGTYMNANYAAEPGVLKNIYEASAGIRLSSTKELWLDAGIFPSHIGWESAIGKDSPTLTRSLAAENSPYFETGVKLGYTTINQKWFLSVLVLNGWQRIQRIEGNTTPALGTQVTYKPSEKITLNSSTFIGNDKPDSVRRMRYFHDFYGIVQVTPKLSATLGFDIGFEQKAKGTSAANLWLAPVAIFRYAFTSRTSVALRGEYYRDVNGVIITARSADGFRTWAYSANLDYKITPNVVWRTEIRELRSTSRIFEDHNGRPIHNDVALSTALAMSF